MPASRVLLVSLVAWLLLAAPAVSAAPSVIGVPVPCHDYREIRRQLADRYGEAPVSLGMRSNGEVLQVFASPQGGTWTIVSTSPSGLACILAAGRGWDAPPLKIIDPGA